MSQLAHDAISEIIAENSDWSYVETLDTSNYAQYLVDCIDQTDFYRDPKFVLAVMTIGLIEGYIKHTSFEIDMKLNANDRYLIPKLNKGLKSYGITVDKIRNLQPEKMMCASVTLHPKMAEQIDDTLCLDGDLLINPGTVYIGKTYWAYMYYWIMRTERTTPIYFIPDGYESMWMFVKHHTYYSSFK